MGRTAVKNTVTTVARGAKRSDIDLVCRQEPGWGAAFKRLREQAGLSQSELAESIECDQSSVAHWESERFKAQPEILRKALVEMGADPRTLFRYFELPPEMKEILDAQLSPEQAAVALGKILLDATSNEQAASAIFDFMTPKVLAATSIKALRDVQAAKLFFERQDKYQQDQSPKRRMNAAIDVTPSTQFMPPMRHEEGPIEEGASE
jgi:transcriptional regulator with XRE-family HTH domain